METNKNMETNVSGEMGLQITNGRSNSEFGWGIISFLISNFSGCTIITYVYVWNRGGP